VVGSALSLRGRQHDLPRGAEDDPLESVGEVGKPDPLVLATGGSQRCLVHEVREVGPDHPGGRGRDRAQVDVVGKRHVTGVDFEDLPSPLLVRRVDRDAPVEAAGPKERLVENLGPVRRGDDDHAFGAGEAVHLREDLVQGLLTLVVPAERRARAAGAADRVELVDEDDRGCDGLRLGEQVADAARADPDDHLDELRGREREERGVRLAGDGPGEERLTSAGRAGKEDAARDLAAEPHVLVRILQEVDDLDELLLRLVDSCHVLERRALRRRLVALRA
jgi:hypothetical protein